MKQRVKPIVMAILLAVVSTVMTMLLGQLMAEAARAATCNVPSGTHPTIQSAVDDSSCDTVNLSAKLYVENVTITRAVTVQGKGADSTTVDGNASGSVFAIQTGLVVTITDMAITNGEAFAGGGINNNVGNLVLDSVRVVSNTATGVLFPEGGGGLYNENGEMQINNSVISGNKAYSGGGIHNRGEATITNSTFSNNQSQNGGGIQNRGEATITDSTFSNNKSQHGGGIYNETFASITVSNVTFIGNSVMGVGGAISNNSQIYVTNSTFSGNSGLHGGGIHHSSGHTANISGTSFTDNSATGTGGGIENNDTMSIINSSFRSNTAGGGGGIRNSGEIYIANSTFSSNSVRNYGGAIDNSGSATISNVTFSGNSASMGGGIYGNGPTSIANSIIASSPKGGDCYESTNSLGYNLDSDGTCNLSAIGDRPGSNPILGPFQGSPGYHPLQVGSPAINAGNPAGCTDDTGKLLTTDQRGQARVGHCDIGAYEYQGIVHTTSLPLALRDFCSDFYDDFGSPASGWDRVDNEFVLAEYLNGEYRVLSRNSDFFYPFPSPSCDRENYVVEADARWVGPPGSSYGIIFSISDDFNDFYLFAINTDFKEFLLFRFYSDSVDTIVPITASPAINGGIASNHLKVTRDGAQIILQINGTVLGTWSDGNISGLTGAGLMSAPYNDDPTSDARFDNFSLTGLPSSTTAQITDGSARATSRSDISIANHIAAPIDAPWWYLKD